MRSDILTNQWINLMRAKKSFGQHFLKHKAIAANIAAALYEMWPEGNVLEVGPGKGILTEQVAARWPSFKAVEADRDMIAWLQSSFPEWQSKIIDADFLTLDLSKQFEGAPFALIGNFPYNISTQILFRLLEYKDTIPVMVGMFQREVAQRIASLPGSRVYGIMSVLAQLQYDVDYCFTVGPEHFSPPPQVQSGVIRLKRRSERLHANDDKKLRMLVKMAFGQRRKMLRNALSAWPGIAALADDPIMYMRPEQLSPSDFVGLCNRLDLVDHTAP